MCGALTLDCSPCFLQGFKTKPWVSQVIQELSPGPLRCLRNHLAFFIMKTPRSSVSGLNLIKQRTWCSILCISTKGTTHTKVWYLPPHILSPIPKENHWTAWSTISILLSLAYFSLMDKYIKEHFLPDSFFLPDNFSSLSSCPVFLSIPLL